MILEHNVLHLILTVVFSFLIGLEIKTYLNKFHVKDGKHIIESARTYTFLGMIGYIFYSIDSHMIVYSIGLVGFTILYAIFYKDRVAQGRCNILTYLAGCIVYSFGPLIELFPLWMSALVFVLMIFIINAKRTIHNLTKKINTNELETLGKIILLSAVILPLLPSKNVIPYVPLSPFKIWLVVVVISVISYIGYLVHKYLFPSKGFFLTGLIGGTYSSTATTVVLAKKARELKANGMMSAAIIAATSVMYLRLIVIAMVFNMSIAKSVSLPFLFFALAGFIVSFFYYRLGEKRQSSLKIEDRNPLELGTAFIFAALFVIMIMATHFATEHYGASGLKMLSFVVGFTDIDPFILSLLTGKYAVTHIEIYSAILISTGSNNILKAIYALWFGGWEKTKHAFGWLVILGIATICVGLFSVY